MNLAPVIPAPNDLVNLLKASDPDVRKTAVYFLVELLRDPDPLIRWGTISCLIHTPLRFYQEPLVMKLQEEDQPEPIRTWARHLNNIRLTSTPASPATIIRVFARIRLLLYLTANLHHCSSYLDD